MNDIFAEIIKMPTTDIETKAILIKIRQFQKTMTKIQQNTINDFLQNSISASVSAFIYPRLKRKTLEFDDKTVIPDEVLEVWCNICDAKRKEELKINPNIVKYDEIYDINQDFTIGIWVHLWKYHPDLFLDQKLTEDEKK
jgi:hypothetical protein